MKNHFDQFHDGLQQLTIEIISLKKVHITDLLDDLNKNYIYHHIQIRHEKEKFKIKFRQYGSKLFLEFPYWKLEDGMSIFIYEEENIHMLTNQGSFDIYNKYIENWAKMYGYILSGDLGVDLLEIFKRNMADTVKHFEQSSSNEKLKECLVKTYLESFENKNKNKEEPLALYDFRFKCGI